MLNKKIVLACMLLMACNSLMALSYDDTTFNAGLEISFVNKGSYNTSGSDALYFKSQPSDSSLAIERNEPGINAYAGARFSALWGGQVGFSFIQEAKANVPYGQATNKISNIFIDALGFLNVARNVDVMGVLGLGMLKSSPGVSGVALSDQSSLTHRKIGIRLGGGLQYYFAEDWATRLTLIYQDGNPSFLKNLLTAAIGLVYTFNI